LGQFSPGTEDSTPVRGDGVGCIGLVGADLDDGSMDGTIGEIRHQLG